MVRTFFRGTYACVDQFNERWTDVKNLEIAVNWKAMPVLILGVCKNHVGRKGRDGNGFALYTQAGLQPRPSIDLPTTAKASLWHYWPHPATSRVIFRRYKAASEMLTRILNSIQVRIKNTWEARQAATAHRYALEKNPEKQNKINDTLDSYHRSNGLKHTFQAYKLLELERLLHHYRPNNIVEFGSGSSSRMFMEYLRQNYLQSWPVWMNKNPGLMESRVMPLWPECQKGLRFITQSEKFMKTE